MDPILENVKIKEKCQQFTPKEMVNTMLDISGYTHQLFGKKVLENSFGSGNILKEIVKRYISVSISEGIPYAVISTGLGNDIYGIELDEKLFTECKILLDGIVTDCGLPPVTWNLYNENALTWNNDIYFDFIIGNPPYITYKELNEDIRSQIKGVFNSCSSGKFDYCYAFIELGIKYLNETGRLVQLVPSNIYKNVFAKELRLLLQEHISVIFDYPSQKIFNEVLTSSSVFMYDKADINNYFLYENKTENIALKIPREHLSAKWEFSSDHYKLEKTARFGDFFNASIVIATLLNEAFIIDKKGIEKHEIETDIIRPTVSPRSLRYKRQEFIIFPYYYSEGKLHHYRSDEFENAYPNAANYLRMFSDKLKKRKSDKNTQWFEYGRTQALTHLNQEKLLLSTVISNQVEVYHLNADTIPYSGIYITSKSDFSLDYAYQLLHSNEFKQYVKRIGINVSGKSIRITSQDINSFEFSRR
jgi:hypothetical protein